MTEFRLPDLGEGLEDAEIITWHVREGDHVVAGQPLVSVETAKAVVDIPSPETGRIAGLKQAQGDIVPIGALLVVFEDEHAVGDATHIAGAGVVGELSDKPFADVDERRVEESLPVYVEVDEDVAGGLEEDVEENKTDRSARGVATPRVRASARATGVDLSTIAGSGPAGSVTLDDVARSSEHSDTDDAVKLQGARRRMASVMRQSGDHVVPATVTDDADVEDWPSDCDITVCLIQALVHASAAEPKLNASFDEAKRLLQPHETVDVGIAVDTPNGLYVPVLRDVANKSPLLLREELDRLVRLVMANKASPQQLSRPTVTLSNFGMLGGRYAALAIVPPQVAIIGTGAVRPTVMLYGGQIVARRILPVSLTFDHRGVTGGEAMRFLRAFIQSLEMRQDEVVPPKESAEDVI